MGKFFEEIPPYLSTWIQKQKIFWVATAPMSADGLVNVSPKGYIGTFHISDSKRVWYEDMSGTGIETISHLRENGRMTIMFCAFEGAPQIVRLFGTGTVHEYDTPEYNAFIPIENRAPGSRAVIVLDIHKVGSSCGYAVPYYTYKAPRMPLHNLLTNMEGEDIKAAACNDDNDSAYPEEGLRKFWTTFNLKSLDGLPALQSAFLSSKVFLKREAIASDYKDSSGARGLEHLNRYVDTKFLSGALVGAIASVVWMKWATSR